MLIDTMAMNDLNYIVVEGPIGVGKTTLARRLATSFSAELLLEEPEQNPFLARFYENPRAHALSTQLYFLLQRVRQTQGLRQSDLFSRVRVADYLMDKDRLFAELTLEADELTLYRQVYAQVVGEPLQPDLVIYLQAPVSVLQDRIANRGIAYEQAVEGDQRPLEVARLGVRARRGQEDVLLAFLLARDEPCPIDGASLQSRSMS